MAELMDLYDKDHKLLSRTYLRGGKRNPDEPSQLEAMIADDVISLPFWARDASCIEKMAEYTESAFHTHK